MSSFEKALRQQLEQIKEDSLYRQRKSLQTPQQPDIKIDGKKFLAFCSNDYLGLANHPELVEAMASGAEDWGVGSGGSHLVVGHQQAHHDLEQALAEFVGYPRALLFSNGYMANIGAIRSLLGPPDEAFQDYLNHASLLDGGWLSRARIQRFAHNDYDDLQQRLLASRQSSADSKRLIISDSVFSMDGEIADIPRLSAIAKQEDGWLMVDDAHGLGVLGENGSGALSHWDLSSDSVEVYVGTLGKAFGCFGAFVAGSELLIETLIQRARTYIFTTALPPALAVTNLKALEIVRKDQWRRDKLAELIDEFKTGAEALGLPLMSSTTAVQPLMYGSTEKTLQVSAALAEQGILITAIRPPTVPVGTSRLRVTLSASHSSEDVRKLIKALARVS
jgi:8-amino-7-oxononanoate synthase